MKHLPLVVVEYHTNECHSIEQGEFIDFDTGRERGLGAITPRLHKALLLGECADLSKDDELTLAVLRAVEKDVEKEPHERRPHWSFSEWYERITIAPQPLAVSIGTRMSIFWPGDDVYYPGTVVDVEGGFVQIEYDDKEIEWVRLAEQIYRLGDDDDLVAPETPVNREKSGTPITDLSVAADNVALSHRAPVQGADGPAVYRAPVRPPRQNPDGSFASPAGRPPSNHEWDPRVGMWKEIEPAKRVAVASASDESPKKKRKVSSKRTKSYLSELVARMDEILMALSAEHQARFGSVVQLEGFATAWVLAPDSIQTEGLAKKYLCEFDDKHKKKDLARMPYVVTKMDDDNIPSDPFLVYPSKLVFDSPIKSPVKGEGSYQLAPQPVPSSATWAAQFKKDEDDQASGKVPRPVKRTDSSGEEEEEEKEEEESEPETPMLGPEAQLEETVKRISDELERLPPSPTTDEEKNRCLTLIQELETLDMTETCLVNTKISVAVRRFKRDSALAKPVKELCSKWHTMYDNKVTDKLERGVQLWKNALDSKDAKLLQQRLVEFKGIVEYHDTLDLAFMEKHNLLDLMDASASALARLPGESGHCEYLWLHERVLHAYGGGR